MKITPEVAKSLISSLVFPRRPVAFFISGSLVCGHTEGSEPQDIDFVCFKSDLLDQLSSWRESAYFVGSPYKKEIIKGITVNAITVGSIGEFQAWSIATQALQHRAGTTWPSKQGRIEAFGYVLDAAKAVLCS